MGSDIITVYHGTYQPFEFVKARCWVTMALEEAEGYANANIICRMEEGLPRSDAGEPWVLRMEVRPDQVEWKDGYGDPDFDGQHGRLLVDVPVIGKERIT